MKRITGGRYTDLRADNNLSLKVVSPETGDVTGVFSLSGGTVDQMYLAMRIAMADLITGTDEILPLFLDEILAQYDDTRTRDTLEFLYELSQQRQIVLFTCKSREVELARSVCGEGLNVINL